MEISQDLQNRASVLQQATDAYKALHGAAQGLALKAFNWTQKNLRAGPEDVALGATPLGMVGAIKVPVQAYRGLKSAVIDNMGMSPKSGYNPFGNTFFSPEYGTAMEFATMGGPAQGKIMKGQITADNMFDYEDVDHLNKLIDAARASGPDTYDAIQRRLPQIIKGNLRDIELDSTLDMIQKAGFNGFSTFEKGAKNIAIWDPKHFELEQVMDVGPKTMLRKK